MNPVNAANVVALGLALGLGSVALGSGSDWTARSPGEAAQGPAPAEVTDSTGVAVPVGPYARILGASHVAEWLLIELCERDRILAVGGVAARGATTAHRFAGIPAVGRVNDAEAIVTLAPDLVVVNNFVNPRAVAQLRRAGLRVFDLGQMRGLASLLDDARVLATLLGVPERGEQYARRLEGRMRAVAADIPASDRLPAMYLGAHGNRLYGGTRGTSYHDVLTYGGLYDVAAERYEGWPALTSEQILALDPPILVTAAGKADLVCRHPGLAALRVCRGEGRIVEVSEGLLLDPGPPMLEAAEQVRDAVYGPPPAAPPTGPGAARARAAREEAP